MFYRQLWDDLVQGGQWSGEIWNRRKNGEIYPEWLTINAVRNVQGKITNYVSIFHDITELKRQQEALEHQAQHDALTGLPNRVLLDDRLQEALKRMARSRKRVALLFLDLDNFKHINDGFGHTAGDNLLIELTQRLKKQLREGDTLARQGGDEFLVLLGDIEDVDDVSVVALRLLDSLKQPFYHEGVEYYVTASIGVTLAPEDGNTSELLIKNADLAMYRAKNLGRNNFQLFTPELDSKAHRRISLEAKLRKVDLLMKTPLKSGTQRFIRDMFLFSTFTGLAYADLHKLSWKDIITEDDGSLWISANRQKSHTEFNVKLLNIPIQIMEYYKGLAPDGKIFHP